jgi:hypothetical protein
MDSVIQRYIIGVMVIHRFGSESCTQITIIMVLKCYWLFIYQICDISRRPSCDTVSCNLCAWLFLPQLHRRIMREITRCMAHIRKICDVHMSLSGASRGAIGTELWYVLSRPARLHSFRLPIFPLQFSMHEVLPGTPFTHIFITCLVWV